MTFYAVKGRFCRIIKCMPQLSKSNCCFVFQSYFFDRDDIALKGFAKFFKESSDEEREHAEKFMKYQNKRGGRVVLQAIQV